MNKYEFIINRDITDKIFVAEIPELKGCNARGDTQAEALKEINKVANEWMTLAKENGWNIPEPKGKLMYA